MSDTIVRFVRETLGCGCPAEVFERIEDERLPGPPCPLRRIAVGGRLLVYLIDPVPEPPDAAMLADLLARGRTERDRLAMNRFRLVIPARDPDRAAMVIAPLFAKLAEGDDRLHLHLLPAGAVTGMCGGDSPRRGAAQSASR